MVLLSFGSSALIETKPEVAAATLAWGQALGEDDPEKVLPLYSDDAVLQGTLSPTARSDRAALRDYFVTAFEVLPGLKVAFGDQLIRAYGSAAVARLPSLTQSGYLLTIVIRGIIKRRVT
jgi:ketosteroid isomerase-like protein